MASKVTRIMDIEKIDIRIVLMPKNEMPYDTYDYYRRLPSGSLLITIADTGNAIYNKLLIIHALIECFLCEIDGVKFEDIDKFDMEFDKKHPGSMDEPGEDSDAPYKKEHLIANAVEALICACTGTSWKEYNDYLQEKHG